MKFHCPVNPEEWQTAYSRDDAYADSGKRASRSFLALLAGVITVSLYIWIFLAPKFNLIAFHPYFRIGILLAPIIIAFVPFLIIRTAAFRFASTFLIDFYRPPEGIDPAKIIANRLNGKPKLPPPLNLLFPFEYILVKDGEITKSDEWPVWSARQLGGPIMLIVFDGCALYLERGNRFSRVVGPGDKIPFLEWYETIKYVVDLRPKVTDGEIDSWTKDGIKIKITIQVECRIGDPKNNDPDNNLVYPYDPLAVKKAIERYAMRWSIRTEGEPTEFSWVDAVWGQVTGIVPGYIGSRMLDDLFIADRHGGQILSPKAVQEIVEKLNNATQVFGVYVTNLQVLEIKFPVDVEQTQKGQWKAVKQSIATIRAGQTSAVNIRAQEKANAEAQRDLILAIANGLGKNKDEKYNEPMLLSLSRILDDSLHDPLLRGYLAKETLETLEKIQEMLK